MIPGKRLRFDDNLPRIRLLAEHDSARRINWQLDSLASTIRQFVDALALIELCEGQINEAQAAMRAIMADATLDASARFEATREISDGMDYPSAWIDMAMRDALISIWDFHESLTTLRASVRATPALAVEDAAIAACIRRFHSEFPNAKLMRHASAHRADNSIRPDEHGFTGTVDIPGVPNTKFHNSNIRARVGRQITITRDHETATLDLTENTLQSLISLQQGIYRLFPA